MKLRLFKKYSPSWTDRKHYAARLQNVLTEPLLEDLDCVYKLTYTEANDTNFSDIISYIEHGNYLSLSFIKRRLPYFIDAFGLTTNTDIYEIYLLIDKEKRYYMAIIYNKLIDDYDEELKFIKRVTPFRYQIYFWNRLLVYPV